MVGSKSFTGWVVARESVRAFRRHLEIVRAPESTFILTGDAGEVILRVLCCWVSVLKFENLLMKKYIIIFYKMLSMDILYRVTSDCYSRTPFKIAAELFYSYILSL